MRLATDVLGRWRLGAVATLRDKSAELSRAEGQPYQPVYIEASDATPRRFRHDYDAVYRFDAVQIIEDVSPADCKRGG